MSLARRRRLVEVARERELLVLEDNPYGLLRYEGEPLPTLYSLDAEAVGRGGASDLVIYLGTFSKILSPGLRLGWAVAPRPVLEKLNLGKQGADLCSSPVTQMFVAAYFAERDCARAAAWLEYVRGSETCTARAARRDAEALGGAFRRAAPAGRAPRAGCSSGRRSTGDIDTTDLLRSRSEGVAFVPGRAAYMDGRSGSSSMRLNFAGVPDEDIREGSGGSAGRCASSSACSARSAASPGRRGLAGGRAPARRAAAMARRRAELAPTWPTSSRCPDRDGGAARAGAGDR